MALASLKKSHVENCPCLKSINNQIWCKTEIGIVGYLLQQRSEVVCLPVSVLLTLLSQVTTKPGIIYFSELEISSDH